MPKINFRAVEKVPISFKFNHERTQPRKHIDYSPKCMRKNLPCNFQLRQLLKDGFDEKEEEAWSNPEIEEKRQIPIIELFKKLNLSKEHTKVTLNSQSVIEPHIPTVNISKFASRKDIFPQQLNEHRFENINKSPSILSNVKTQATPAFERFVKRDENKYYLKNFYNKIECQGDYDPIKSIKALSKTQCMVNIGSNKKFKEDIKVDLNPEYDMNKVMIGGFTTGAIKHAKVVPLDKQVGRDNKMYFISENMNLESESARYRKRIFNIWRKSN